MVSMLFVLAGCTYSSGSIVVDPDDERAHGLQCRGGDLEACYMLRSADDPTTRSLALSRACEGGFRDSCALLYEWAKDRSELGSTSMALSAAIDGCRQGSPSLCQKALDFAEIDPDRAPVIEKHRAELEALLAEHSK